jgi:hypothetical protein
VDPRAERECPGAGTVGDDVEIVGLDSVAGGNVMPRNSTGFIVILAAKGVIGS